MQARQGLFARLFEEVRDASGELDEQFGRDEALDATRLEQRARALATEHELSAKGGRGWLLLPQFLGHRQSLLTTYPALVVALREGREIPPAAETLVKNFHHVEEQLRVIGQRLTSRYYRDVPALKGGPLAGFPRVYAVTSAFLAQTNGRLAPELLKAFLRAYQQTAPMTVREVQALELTLRLVLVEKLSRLVTRITAGPAEPEREWQAEAQTASENIVAGMESLSRLDWRELFATVSDVDAALYEDPSRVYPQMDFVTQESYRQVVARVARRSRTGERETAALAVELAARAHEAGQDVERAHVGYYLVGDGVGTWERALGYRPDVRERVVRAALRRPSLAYLSAFALVTLAVVAGCVAYALRGGAGPFALAAVALLSLIPSSEIASVGLRLASLLAFTPRRLPKMDTSSGLPDDAKTLVVVPTILSSEAAVRESLETIEGHYLANQDANIFFGLLGDWAASPREEMPGDDALLAAALSGVRELNARYGDGTHERFHLFHRRRMWNESEGEWIGWEKKRGKLLEFNRLLRGASDTSYTTCTAVPQFLARVRYVISLDSDSELPRDGARRLVGAALHPLNRPRVDATTGRVTRGYGILQPLVSIPPPKARRERVPQILSGTPGLNPYTNPAPSTAPNVYQDIFGEGNYVGKALYDVDAFEAALRDRFPENTLLSHDLLEGLYARTALVTDVEIFDRPPSHYVALSRRAHRWTRGDWQLLPWLLPRARDARGRRARNALPLIGRWRMIDNLRRSLFAPATFLWLTLTWLALPGSPAMWTALITLVFIAPVFIHLTTELLIHRGRTREAAFLKDVRAVAKISVVQALYSLAYMAHQAYLMLDAIARTLYRLFVSHRHMLEWVTAAQTQKESTLNPRLFVRYMWPALALALAGVAVAAVGGARTLLPAAPLLLAWFASPALAYLRSRRMEQEFGVLEENVEREVRFNARYAWSFFAATDARAPGEVRPAPESLTDGARRLLWTTAAYDLGAVGTLELAERMEAALARIRELQAGALPGGRQGASDTPAAPTPQHVLLSETGNLGGYLRALGPRCVEFTRRPLFDGRVVEGVTDTLLLMRVEFLGVKAGARSEEERAGLDHLWHEIEMCLAFLRAAAREESPQTIAAWRRFFNILEQRAAVTEVLLEEYARTWPAVSVDGLRAVSSYFDEQARELKRELREFAPWTRVPMAHLEPSLRRHCAPALELWGQIETRLNRPVSIYGLPETSDALLVGLAGLREQLGRCSTYDASELQTVLATCDELRAAVEEASRAADEARARFTRLADESRAAAEATDFRRLFDEEYSLLRSRFQISLADWKRDRA